MRNKLTLLSFKILLLAVTIISCRDGESVSTDIVPDIETTTLIYGYLSPEKDTLQILVSKTLPYIDESIDELRNNYSKFIVKDARVFLENEVGDQVTLVYNEKSFNYEILQKNFPINANESYRLKVEVDENTYSATCTIPDHKVKDLEAKTIITSQTDERSSGSFSIQFEGNPGELNYFLVTSEIENNAFSPLEFENGGLFTDEFQESNKIIGTARFFQIELPDTTSIHINSITSDFYNFLKATYDNSTFPFGSFNSANNVPLPTNIVGENVNGHFAGYRLFSKKVDLK